MDARLTRLITTTLLGVLFGIVNMLLFKYTVGMPYWPPGVSFLWHHAVMGLVIGVSSLKMNWATHGVFWGGAFGLCLAFIFVSTPLAPWVVFITVVVWGFLIEALTTRVLRRPA